MHIFTKFEYWKIFYPLFCLAEILCLFKYIYLYNCNIFILMIFDFKVQMDQQKKTKPKKKQQTRHMPACKWHRVFYFLYYLINEDMLEKEYLFFSLEWICSLLPVNAIRKISIATNGDAWEKCSQSFRKRNRSLVSLRNKYFVYVGGDKWKVAKPVNLSGHWFQQMRKHDVIIFAVTLVLFWSHSCTEGRDLFVFREFRC